MEREQIIKALECCIKVCKHRDVKFCRICPLRKEKCILELPKKSLALIKELTAKTEAQDIVIAKLRKKLGKAEHDADRYANRIKELIEEADRHKKRADRHFENLKSVLDERSDSEADTVRKMQERLKANAFVFANNTRGDKFFAVTTDDIDQIAKEMLEEEATQRQENREATRKSRAIASQVIYEIAKEMLEENENGQRENN